jgi:hypothetical protein
MTTTRTLNALAAGALLLLAACASKREPQEGHVSADDARSSISHALPAKLASREGWIEDVYAGFRAQSLEPTRSNVCAVAAVIAQESGFQVNPVIPGLPAIAWKEIRTRATAAGAPWVIVHGALELTSGTGRSYADRIDHARTEKDLSDIFEDFIGAVPLGHTLFEDRNPIRTRGPMQVNIAYVRTSPAASHYPWPINKSLADELFTRRGSIYFGIAHLLGYEAPYDSLLYRFADYNAGQYASRNAAFQAAVNRLAHAHVATDGALLPPEGHGAGETQSALEHLTERLRMDAGAIHDDLLQGKSAQFGQTALNRRVFDLAEQSAGRTLPRALVPAIQLQGPKITRKLSTDWYAHRVDGRYQQCLKQ